MYDMYCHFIFTFPIIHSHTPAVILAVFFLLIFLLTGTWKHPLNSFTVSLMNRFQLCWGKAWCTYEKKESLSLVCVCFPLFPNHNLMSNLNSTFSKMQNRCSHFKCRQCFKTLWYKFFQNTFYPRNNICCLGHFPPFTLQFYNLSWWLWALVLL